MKIEITRAKSPPPIKGFPCWVEDSEGNVGYAFTENTGFYFPLSRPTEINYAKGGLTWEGCGYSPMTEPFTLHITP